MTSLKTAVITRREDLVLPSRWPQLLLLRLFLLITMACATITGMSPNSSDTESGSTPYRVELIDTGPKTNSTSNFGDYFFVRLYSLESQNSSSFEVRLHRDPTLNRQLEDVTDYNVFVIDENGDDQRVDGLDLHNDHRQAADSKVAFFRGHLVGRLKFSDGQDDILILDSLVMAIGYLDPRNGFISLQAFIRRQDGTLLYLHPGTETGTTTNLHYLSRENDQLGGSFFEHFQRQFEVQRQKHQQKDNHLRRKRNADREERKCPMMILADYSLYQLMNESRAKTVLFIHFVFTLANDIFESTAFTRTGLPPSSASENEDEEEVEFHYSGYGHLLCRIVIEEHLAERETDHLYNAGRSYWPQTELEIKLKRFKERKNHCISFLFTNLEIRASSDSQYADLNGFAMQGGIWSTDEELSNVGVVSFSRCKDPWNLLCALTFSHELGHLWGAPHDIDTAECMPRANGSYLVSFPFLDQIGPNNFKFSPCSIRGIYEKIEKLHGAGKDFISFCTKCGNGRIEDGEECDELTFIEGDVRHSLDETDDEAVNGQRRGNCCTRSCKLKSGAKCSNYNHQCCNEQCQIYPANSSHPCFKADLQYCFAEAFCDGTLNGCPVKRGWRPGQPRPTMADGTPCLNGGTCQAGYCNSTCPAGSADCECPTWEPTGCKVCCQQVLKNFNDGAVVTRGECRPLTDLFKPEGAGCLFNKTQVGVCTTDGWCRVRKDELSEGTVFPVTPSTIGDDDDDFDREDFWALMQMVGGFLLILLLFGAVLLIRCVFRTKTTGRFELFDDHTTADLNNSTKHLLPPSADQDKDEPHQQESCFSCLPGKTAKISAVEAVSPPSSSQLSQTNGFSKSGSNV